MPTSASETISLMETYFKWSERLGTTAVIAGFGFLVLTFLVIWILSKLIESYVGQINDVRKQRDKFQDLVAKKISSQVDLENLKEDSRIELNEEKKGNKKGQEDKNA